MGSTVNAGTSDDRIHGLSRVLFVLINASNMHLSQHPQFDMQERVVHAGRTWGDVGIKGH
jgi:hypothetical protein